MARYAILIYEAESGYAEGGQEAWQQAGEAHGRFAGQVGEKGGKIVGGDALEPTSTATSVRGDLVTDGPFAETKEALAGYYMIECANLDEAIEWATKIPTACKGGEGCIEIRPLPGVPARDKPLNG